MPVSFIDPTWKRIYEFHPIGKSPQKCANQTMDAKGHVCGGKDLYYLRISSIHERLVRNFLLPPLRKYGIFLLVPNCTYTLALYYLLLSWKVYDLFSIKIKRVECNNKIKLNQFIHNSYYIKHNY